MTVRAIPTTGGGHDVVTDNYARWGHGAEGGPLVLVRVRPVGTLEWGDLPMFVPEWVPELVEALSLARAIGDRREPWRPYVPDETPVAGAKQPPIPVVIKRDPERITMSEWLLTAISEPLGPLLHSLPRWLGGDGCTSARRCE